jgi:RimK family alpha-L-glutamate ligase
MGWHIEGLQRAFARRGVAADHLSITRIRAGIGAAYSFEVEGRALDAYQGLLIRIIPDGSLEQIIFRMDALHCLEQRGIKVMNSPTTIERTVDKFYTSSLLDRHGIPTPRTVVAEHFDDAMEAFEKFGDVIVKPLFGSGGRGMVRVNDYEVAYRTFRALEMGRYVFYLQEYVAHGDHDVRALVVGDRVVAAMVRRSAGWRHNVARGARPEPCQLDPESEAICLRAARILRADYAGVDLFRAADGRLLVIEVNSIPGWSGLQSTTTTDIADAIAGHLAASLPT